jgi:hypothetical protein
MDEIVTGKRLVVLRKLTRAIADFVRGQLKDHLIALAPLFRPRLTFGEYVKSDVKETGKSFENAFKELQALYAKIAVTKPFNLNGELKSPVEVMSGVLEFTPVDYAYAAKTETDSKQLTMISPLKWILNYASFTPRALRELMAQRDRTTAAVESAVQHALLLQIVLARQPGLHKLLDSLHFTITSAPAPGLGDLPIVTISSAIPTIRPPDELIIESTEISGTDSFEEVVSLSDPAVLRDPFRDKIVELAKAHGEELGPK